MARAREVAGLDCEEPFATAAARVIEVRVAEVFDHADRVLEIDDIEPVHDMRVATRRLRAALEAFQPCFPGKPWRKALRRVKALGDALGERRDRDVQIELMTGLIDEVAAAEKDAFGALVEELRAEQQRANSDLAPCVAPERLMKLRARLEALVEQAGR